MIDSVRCEYCNLLFLKLDPALFDNDPGISKASISKHDCPLKFGGKAQPVIDFVKCLHCGYTFLTRGGVMYEAEPKPGKVRLEEHKCQAGNKTQVFEVSDYKAAMLLIDLPALDKRLSIDMNYQPVSQHRIVKATRLNERIATASELIAMFQMDKRETQLERLPKLLERLTDLGYIVTYVGPIDRNEKGQLSQEATMTIRGHYGNDPNA